MDAINLKARAKINLTLDVLGRRNDGYHELKMVMQTIALSDGVLIKKSRGKEISLSSNLSWLPNDERNLAYRAAALLREEAGITDGVEIALTKRIPAAAGLAGGSSDAAAVLLGMNALFELAFTKEELAALGKKLGADIPFCIYKNTCLAEGIGERLRRVADCPECFLVLAKPPLNLSAGFVFSNFEMGKGRRPDTEGMLAAIAKKDLSGVAAQLCNVLEDVVFPMYPQVQRLRDELLSLGAMGALMSGSGSTVFGIFANREDACTAADRLRDWNRLLEVIVTELYQEAQE